jgi:hypothetical protein
MERNGFKKYINSELFFVLIIALVLLSISLVLTLLEGYTSTPMMRTSLTMKITPFVFLCSSLCIPFLYFLINLAFKRHIKFYVVLVLALPIVIFLSYVIGWVFFNFVLDLPFLPINISKHIIPEMAAISLPLWLALASLYFMVKVRRDKESFLASVQKADLKHRQHDYISATHRNKVFFLDPKDIVWVKSEGNYVKIFTTDRFYIRRTTLVKLLDSIGVKFIRIHKSHIVNIDFVKNLTHQDHGDLILTLKSGDQLKCSRNYTRKIREITSF